MSNCRPDWRSVIRHGATLDVWGDVGLRLRLIRPTELQIIMSAFATMAAPDTRGHLAGDKHIPEPVP